MDILTRVTLTRSLKKWRKIFQTFWRNRRTKTHWSLPATRSTKIANHQIMKNVIPGFFRQFKWERWGWLTTANWRPNFLKMLRKTPFLSLEPVTLTWPKNTSMSSCTKVEQNLTWLEMYFFLLWVEDSFLPSLAIAPWVALLKIAFDVCLRSLYHLLFRLQFI